MRGSSSEALADLTQMDSEESCRAIVKFNEDDTKTLKELFFKPCSLVEQLEASVRELLEIETDFQAVLYCESGQSVHLNNNPHRRIEELITINPSLQYSIVVNPDDKRNMSLYVNDMSEDDLLLGASASPTTGEAPSSDGAPIPEDYADMTNMCYLCNKETNVEQMSVAETTNYVGLVNQAMTCYLNSLVQALFMTPEFRNAIYNWEFDGVNEARSIPYQLQRLFLNLQTSLRSAVETTDLTTSFGWQGSEAWHQHDIQELCRVMFDALERKFKDTKQANLINDLYEGRMLDYVKCLECGTEKSREDTFLDIPLPVRPFGSQVAYNSVEEALRAFVQPETLEGNNQYHCEKCQKKCDAHKGLKFTKFPYLLTLHLKRFDFDYNTMHRIKLNDKVVFPEKLNLNSFTATLNGESEVDERESGVKCDDCSTTDSGSALDDESCQGTDLSSVVNEHDETCEDSDEGIDVSSGTTHENEAKGPYNYELFSIMIHSGSASGGHYYAYIRDFDREQWLCFNDQSVNRITEDDIRKTYGGGPQKGYYSGMYSSSTNAYMLMYRQIDKERNCNAMKLDEFPPHMHKLLQYMRDKEHTDRKKEKKNNSCKLTVHCCHPVTEEFMDIRLTLLLDATLEEAVSMAHRRFKLEGLADVDDCRMVIYNKKLSSIDYSFESNDLKFCDIVDKLKVLYSDWLLEIKPPGTEFQTFKKGGLSIKTYYINVETEDVQEPVQVRVDAADTVRDLKQKITAVLGLEGTSAGINIALEKLFKDAQLLDNDDAPVFENNYDCVSSTFKLFVSNTLDENPAKRFKHSQFKKIIERFEYIVPIGVLIPDTDPLILENLFIPMLDQSEIDRTSSPGLRVSPGVSGDLFGDQSNSEDSSLSDSDRTLVGDAPGGLFSSSSTSPADQHMTSPSDPTEDVYNYEVLGNPVDEMHWDSTTTTVPKSVNYFKVTSIKDCRQVGTESSHAKLYKLFVDIRMTLETFKKHLETIMKIPKEHFKIYRHGPDEEWTTLTETLRMLRDGHIITVKLGRALSMNEYNCKIYLLKHGSTDTNYFLFEHIIGRGQSVGQVKKDILFKAKKQHMLDLTPSKSRLREKSLKKPREVYLDEQIFGEDVTVLSNTEIFLQELSEVEPVTSSNQLVLFARQWHPAAMSLGAFHEVVLDSPSMNELKARVATVSGVPVEHLQVAFVRSVYPCDMHLLDIHTELDWNTNAMQLDPWPLQVDHGTTFFYRDGREQLKELTSEEKKELSIRENNRLGRVVTRNCPSLEKSLRIYLDNWPSETEDNCID